MDQYRVGGAHACVDGGALRGVDGEGLLRDRERQRAPHPEPFRHRREEPVKGEGEGLG